MIGQVLATKALPLDGDLVLTYNRDGDPPWLLSRYPGVAAVGAPSRDWTLQMGLDLAREWAVDLWDFSGDVYQRLEAYRGLQLPTPPARVPTATRPYVAERRRRA